MKKLLVTAGLVLALGAFFYYYFSAPRVIDRRMNSLLDSLSFGAVSLQEKGKSADNFADHFAEEIRFSGAGNDIITGSPSQEDLRSLYLDQLRGYAKSSEAKRSGETEIRLQGSDRAVMSTTVSLRVVSFANTSHQQEIPSRFTWVKKSGNWLISEVRLESPPNLR
jgi:hypothetical protein